MLLPLSLLLPRSCDAMVNHFPRKLEIGLYVIICQRVEVATEMVACRWEIGRVKVRLSIAVGEIKWCAFRSRL